VGHRNGRLQISAPFSNDLPIGNLGDGTINAYDATTGASLGTMKQQSGSTVQIPGLWGIAFGNGLNRQPTNTSLFASGPNSYADGIFGRIDFNSAGSTTGSGGY
jgi:hypothetical protein